MVLPGWQRKLTRASSAGGSSTGAARLAWAAAESAAASASGEVFWHAVSATVAAMVSRTGRDIVGGNSKELDEDRPRPGDAARPLRTGGPP